jgi:cytochrome c553
VRKLVEVTAVLAAFVIPGAFPAGAAELPPPWAYPVNPPGTQAPPDDGVARRVPGSSATFTLTQIRDLFAAPDWRPEAHAPMPEIVSRGRKPAVHACGFCHLPNGLGRPENSSLAGLPAAYIAQQVADFKSGARKSAEPASLPVNLMIAVARAATEAEVQVAADYFAALKPLPWIRVVETDTVPKTRVGGWMLVAAEPAGTEPIGNRIIEMPVDLERTELRDPASGFIAYAPVGSIAKGEALVTSGAGRTLPCSICHGADLKGLGPAPALAGRSPSYLVRQLFDLKHGFRNGAGAMLMTPVVGTLTDEDMVSVSAYAASREP